MNIWNVIVIEVKHNIRNYKSMSMMILLPIMLILILGSALSGSFNPELDDLQVMYAGQMNTSLGTAFKSFMDSAEKQGIVFAPAGNDHEGMEGIKGDKYAAYVRVGEKDNQLELFKNDRFALEAGIFESMLQAFVQKYNTDESISAMTNNVLPAMASNDTSSFTDVISVDGGRQPKSMDYYSITMLTMIIFYGMYPGTLSIKREKYTKAGLRLIASPIKKYQLMAGKIVGAFTATVLQVAVVMLFNIFILKAYWGSHLITVILIILSEALMSVSLGIGMALMFKNESAMYVVLNFLPVLSTFLAGGFVALDGSNRIIEYIGYLLPIKWVNSSIFGVIYNNDFTHVPIAIGLNLAIVALIVLLSKFTFNKEAITS